MYKKYVYVLTAVLLMTIGVITPAQSANAPVLQLNLAVQPLADALRELASLSNTNIGFDPLLVDGMQAPALNGALTAQEALKQLLVGTKLQARFVDDKTVSLIPEESKAAGVPAAGNTTTGLQKAKVPGGEGRDEEGRMRVGQSDASAAATSGTPQSASEEAGSNKVEEIIVTAQKRVERLQDVPMSIAVIGHQDIERRGLIGMGDYLRSIPGVNQTERGSGNSAIVIRGITTSPDEENFNSGSTVATYFDETPTTGSAGMGGGTDVRPVDFERIEVLRGPQGTAYGSSSLGGTVRMIPVKPKLDAFSAKVAASYSGTSGAGSDNSMVQGIVNIPVVADQFAVRAVGYRFGESGFYRNIAGVDPAMIAFAEGFGLGDYVRGAVQEDVGEMRSTGARLAALWNVTDKLDLSMNFLSQKTEQDGVAAADAGKFEQTYIPIAPQARIRGQKNAVSDTDVDLANLVLNYDFGWAALTSAASWLENNSATGSDLSKFFGLPFTTTIRSDFRSLSSETRLASKLDGRVQFLMGLYYEDVKDGFVQTGDWPGTEAANPFGPGLTFSYNPARRLDQRAVFGEVSYELTSKLTATVGGRFFKYEKDERLLTAGSLVQIPAGTVVRSDLDSTESNSSYKANLSYQPNTAALVYASWAEGFRLGRPSAGLPSGTCDPNGDGVVDGTGVSIESTKTIDSDFLESYEVGGKFALFERRLVIDSAVYHIKWDGLPIRTFAPAPCNLAYVANVGAATSNGVEFQASLAVMDGVRVDFGGSYTKAELSQDALAQGWQEGDRLPGSPKVSVNLAAQYDFDVAGHNAFVRADSFYAGKFHGDLQETPGTLAGDYIKVDMRAGVEIRSINVELFVRNLTNENAFTWRGLSNANDFFGYRLRPRTIGIQVGYNFE